MNKTIREILVLHHTHTDVGYTHPQPVFWDLSLRFIDQAIDLCEATAHRDEPSRVRWTCETTLAVMRWLEQADEGRIQRLRALVKAGQISFGALPINITPLFSAEGLASALRPVAALRKQLGAEVKVAIQHDINGVPWPLAGLLLDAGVEALTMGINVHTGGFPGRRPRAFWWETPDGRRLLVWNGEHYNTASRYFGLRASLKPADMAVGWAKYEARLQAEGYPYDFAYITLTHPAFDDNNPPSPEAAGAIAAWNAEGRSPVIRYATPEMLLERLRAQPSNTIPVVRGDWPDWWSFGVGSSAVETMVGRRARSLFRASRVLDRTLPPNAARQRQTGEIERNLILWEEHTWGGYGSTGSFAPNRRAEPLHAAEQWMLKAAYAYQADSVAMMALRDQLEQLAGNPGAGRGAAGLLVYNPTGAPRRACVAVPKDVLGADWWHGSSHIHYLDSRKLMLADSNRAWVGPVELPPFAWTVVKPSECSAPALPAGVQADEGVLRSPHYELRFDAATGRVTSLKAQGRADELVDASSPWEFFGCVRETVAEHTPFSSPKGDEREVFHRSDWDRLHDGLSCWETGWKARREKPSRVLSVRWDVTPEGARLVRQLAGDGFVELEQTILLSAYEPRVICDVWMNKQEHPEPEGVYFTFPLNIPASRIHYETAGLAVEHDADQMPGTCRDYVCADRWVAAHNDQVNVVIACPDAPLWQFDDFHFGRVLTGRQPAARALLLAWPLNNYWNTNFRASQPGPLRLRYEVSSFARFDPAAATQCGESARAPLEFHPVVRGANP